MPNDFAEIRELSSRDVRHCATPYFDGPRVILAELETLPYHKLGGPGLERLCYELLLANGYEPRFFGRSGQPQYGVDLVAEKAGRVEVFQCKNVRRRPTTTELENYLQTFEHDWLKQADLPHPHRFVICCPSLLRDLTVDANWLRLKDSFQRRTNVEVGLWDLDILDGWLKTLPDIVSDLFSDRHAETFCDVDSWKADLFRPLRRGDSADARLRRYFNSLRNGRLYIDVGRRHEITDALNRSPVVLVRGLPGTGKTFTALAVAEQHWDAQRRTYFVDVASDEFTAARLKDGIRSRLSRPSTFVLENCHENPDAVAQALDDIAPLLEARRTAVLCLLRRVPGPFESRSDDWILESQRTTVDFENDDDLLMRVVRFWRPEFAGLSDTRLSKLAAVCGRDLYLLDEVLTRLDSPREVDNLSPSRMYDMVRFAYFGRQTADDFPVTLRLAALAQFGLYPRADVLRPPPDELTLLDSFCIRGGQPPRWHFLHSTAAELVLHSLWSGMGVLKPDDVAAYAADDVIDYFREAQSRILRPPTQVSSLGADLIAILESGLKLAGDAGGRRLKAAVLDSEAVQQLLRDLVDEPAYPRLLDLCARVAHYTEATTTERYARLLGDAIRRVANPSVAHPPPDPSYLGFMLQALELTAPSLYSEVVQELDAVQILSVLNVRGTIFDLFFIVSHTPPLLAQALVEALNDSRVDTLLTATIAAARSIGTLHMSLRELWRRPPMAQIARELERRVGPDRLLRLIEANGTIYELFNIINDSSPEFATVLTENLTQPYTTRLLTKTIATGRSIGTLHLTLRDLHRGADTKETAMGLERQIGAARFLRLIESNGTIYELFRILERASPVLAGGLVDGLTDDYLDRLVDKTIARGRSIATMNLTFVGMRKRKETFAISREMERRIGTARFLRLIDANGSVFELFMIIRDASSDFARKLLGAFDAAYMERLITKTIASGRSIGTLNVALRDLHSNPNSAELAVVLEARLGAVGFWRLILETGSPGPLVDLLRDISPAFKCEVLEAARRVHTSQWQRMLARSDFFNLCKLVAGAEILFADDAGGPSLLAAVEAQAPELAARASWYELNTAAKRLSTTSDSAAKAAASQSLTASLRAVHLETLTFATLKEAINGVDVLYQFLPEARVVLASRLRELLPAPDSWSFNPREEMAIPRILLRLLGSPEFAADVDFYVQGLLSRLSPGLIAQCRAVDILWLLWGLFALASGRNENVDPVAFGNSVPTELIGSVRDTLVTRCATYHGEVDEIRARFALVGLLDLFGFSADRAVLTSFRQELARHEDAGAWWLCANQTFVTAYLVLRSVQLSRPLSSTYRRDFRARLLSAAEDYPVMYPAAQYLYDQILRRQVEKPRDGKDRAIPVTSDLPLTDPELRTLAYASFKEAVKGLTLLYERPDMRPHLASRLRALLPPPETWVLEPNIAMGVPRYLLRLLAGPEFSESDVRYFVDGLIARLLPSIATLPSADVLRIVWSLFGLARTRNAMEPAEFARGLPSAFVSAIQDNLTARASQPAQVAEMRGRFALVGLLALMELPVGPPVLAALRAELARHADAGAWWLCVDQSFAKAWLILHAVEVMKPLPPKQRATFGRRLLSAAEDNVEGDAAADYLRRKLPFAMKA